MINWDERRAFALNQWWDKDYPHGEEGDGDGKDDDPTWLKEVPPASTTGKKKEYIVKKQGIFGI